MTNCSDYLESRADSRTDSIAQAIRDAGNAIAQAILVAFLEPEEQLEHQEFQAEQQEIERVLRLQRGSDDEAPGIGDS